VFISSTPEFIEEAPEVPEEALAELVGSDMAWLEERFVQNSSLS